MKVQLSLAPEKIPVVCLMGPTATGKTDAAAQIYESIDAEIISVDSSLVYTGMDIGTAKPDADFLAKYPHHLVNVRHPNEGYSVADFFNDCSALIADITARGKLPVLAGGTMFYFNTLERGLTELPQADQALRDKITDQASRSGWPVLHQRLAVLDPQSADRIDPMDAQRIQRALEIVLAGGKPVAAHNDNRKLPPPNPLLKIASAFSDRAVLHQRIARRFDIMLDAGLEVEVRDLLASGVDANSASMRMIGYRQMLKYLDGEIDLARMREKGIIATRQLAKRQLTWLRNQSNLLWWVDHGLEDKEFQELVSLVKQYV
ncbi:MAG: tRNA (adenosine(37)-N6)-dimethylallyltransferase MiaA [Arenicella sp.]|nr:tRNA (adenosine(37)-N6)-dimethylallyltransferase MiaA [Arenicella sp.]